MDNVNASLIYYNANTRNAHVGDCVKRGLSVAYSMDYDAVGAELNRIKRQKGFSAYNLEPVFKEFMKVRGDTFTKVPAGEQVTAEEFAAMNPTGVYVVLVGKDQSGRSTHLAAIVDGDLFDSWNSLNYFVNHWAKVSGGNSDIYSMDGEEITKEVARNLSEYVDNNLSHKLPDVMSVHVVSSIARENKYTYEITIRCNLGDMPMYCRYRDGARLLHQLTLKLNPRMSEEENLASLTKKCKQKVYDYLYNIKAEIAEAQKVERAGVHKYYICNHAAEMVLGKMPEWAIPHITKIWDNGAGYDYGERYELEMEALPDDPRYKENRYVDFYADSITELKRNLEWYKADYSRINYDY